MLDHSYVTKESGHGPVTRSAEGRFSLALATTVSQLVLVKSLLTPQPFDSMLRKCFPLCILHCETRTRKRRREWERRQKEERTKSRDFTVFANPWFSVHPSFSPLAVILNVSLPSSTSISWSTCCTSDCWTEQAATGHEERVQMNEPKDYRNLTLSSIFTRIHKGYGLFGHAKRAYVV